MSGPTKDPDKNSDNKEEELKRSHVKLKRAHRAEVRLAFMTLSEAHTRYTAAQEAARIAQISVMNARESSKQTSDQILKELGLAPENVIDVENLVVLPPPSEEFLVGIDD